jgi:hypothetical protein
MAVRICKNGHEVADDKLFHCPTCQSADLRPDSVSQATAAATKAATRRGWKRHDALRRLRGVLMWGIGLYVLGAIVWVVSVNAVDDVDSVNGVGGGGLGGGAMVGLVLGGLSASAGAAMVLVFLIGWGVKLGREASDV